MRLAFCIAVVFLMWGTGQALCQEAGKSESSHREELLTGDIPLHDMAAKNRDINQAAAKEVESWVKTLVVGVNGSKGGAAPQELGGEGVGYLAALYLLCTSKRGPCAFILESMLEADLLASKQNGSPRCATMNRFWKTWLANSGDRRLQFKIPIGLAPELAKFNSSVRPRFVRCKETVEGILADSKGLSQRYGADSAAAQSVTSLSALLGEVKKGSIDLFATTGVVPQGQ